MDENRQIRFLIPPFFLYASLLWFAYIDPYLHCSLSGLFGASLKEMIPLLATAGAATIPIGYSIGTIGLLALKGIFRVYYCIFDAINPRQLPEATVNREAFASILLATRSFDDELARPNLLYAVATFDHELLPKGINEWIRRRFNAFVVASNSCLAIFISFVIVIFLSRCHACGFDRLCGLSEAQWKEQEIWASGSKKAAWLQVNFSLMVTLAVAAYVSWKETMGMIEFQAQRTNVDELSRRGHQA